MNDVQKRSIEVAIKKAEENINEVKSWPFITDELMTKLIADNQAYIDELWKGFYDEDEVIELRTSQVVSDKIARELETSE